MNLYLVVQRNDNPGVITPHRRAPDGQFKQWVIQAPKPEWAQKLFPGWTVRQAPSDAVPRMRIESEDDLIQCAESRLNEMTRKLPFPLYTDKEDAKAILEDGVDVDKILNQQLAGQKVVYKDWPEHAYCHVVEVDGHFHTFIDGEFRVQIDEDRGWGARYEPVSEWLFVDPQMKAAVYKAQPADIARDNPRVPEDPECGVGLQA